MFLDKNVYLFACAGQRYKNNKETLFACAFYPSFYSNEKAQLYPFPYDIEEIHSDCKPCLSKSFDDMNSECRNLQCHGRFKKCDTISKKWPPLCGKST